MCVCTSGDTRRRPRLRATLGLRKRDARMSRQGSEVGDLVAFAQKWVWVALMATPVSNLECLGDDVVERCDVHVAHMLVCSHVREVGDHCP